MKKILVALALLFFGAALVTFADESIVDVAKKEKARRAKISKPAKVITNKEIEEFKAKGNVTAGTIETTSAPEGAVPDFTPTQESKDAAADQEAMKQQIVDAQRRVEDAQNRVKQLEQRAAANVYNVGVSQLTGQAAADADELSAAKQALQDAQSALQTAQDSARKSGVPVPH